MDINTVATFTRDVTASILALLTIGKIVSTKSKAKRPSSAKNKPANKSAIKTVKPVRVRIMDSIIPLGLILLVSLPLFSSGDVFRFVMVGLAFLISGVYIFVISSSRS